MRNVIIFHWEDGKSYQEIANIVSKLKQYVPYVIQKHKYKLKTFQELVIQKCLLGTTSSGILREIIENPKMCELQNWLMRLEII